MTYSDFDHIQNFTPKEVERTGAKLLDVKTDLIYRYDIFRNLIKVPVVLLHNGITSGEHQSPGHKEGLAGDCALLKELPCLDVFKAALEAGFRKIGIYWGGKRYTYHLEVSQEFGFWIGTPGGLGDWRYGSLLVDPKVLVESR